MAIPIRLTGVEPSVGYNLALALLFGLAAAAVFTLAATLWAAARVPARGGPVGAGLAAVAVCLVLGNLAGVEGLAGRVRPAGRLRLVRPVARDRGHDQRVPVVLVHARGPARARPRRAVHPARARLRAPGGAGRAARRRRVAGGRRGARGRPRRRRALRGELLVLSRRPRACWCWPWRSGCASPDAAGRRGFGAVWTGLVLLACDRARAPVLARLRPGGARARRGCPSASRSRSSPATWR